ncbi:ABC transporter A family member 2 [Dendrobium catenatum]|uniref:ABC transporter A family member 2 n=1 Tax=Dendrobium catenatum TaxID=906689 RepID=A0A2I0VW82_9ASPA|nr:ABC transporter A family member 2 [Dendrobium catenatum]
MDPISRRHVWDIIENAKKGRAIVLTTHSMEEADILSDRIAIMAKGRLRCFGTSIRLKSRFGTGYIANISFLGSTPIDAEWEAAHVRKAQLVKHFFKHDFFAELQDRENELGISDIQLGLTTLEEVFLNIAKQAELESASADGSMIMLNLSSGGAGNSKTNLIFPLLSIHPSPPATINDLFTSSSFKKYTDLKHQIHIDDVDAGGGNAKNLEKFFQDIEIIKEEIKNSRTTLSPPPRPERRDQISPQRQNDEIPPFSNGRRYRTSSPASQICETEARISRSGQQS